MSSKVGRPAADEHNPYYSRYINRAAGDDPVEALESDLTASLQFFSNIDEATSLRSYEAGKWTIRQVLGHLIDSERVFAYRALRFARNDQTPLAGFEQDDWMNAVDFNRIELSKLLKEFELVRRSNLAMFRKLNGEEWLRRGIANNSEISVRALAFIIAGHSVHHRIIVKERYLEAKAATQ